MATSVFTGYLKHARERGNEKSLILDTIFENLATFMMRCAIWYHLYNFENVKNTHGGVLILVKLEAPASNFTKITTP